MRQRLFPNDLTNNIKALPAKLTNTTWSKQIWTKFRRQKYTSRHSIYMVFHKKDRFLYFS